MKDQLTIESENNAPFIVRFYKYLNERFPIIGHGILITSFSFSAVSYSILTRGESSFINTLHFLGGIFTTITLFFLLRIFDEFKDAEDDSKFRPGLPVPRGLISLNELRNTGIVVFILQFLVNILLFPKMLILFSIVIFYLLLMGKEFFIGKWLKKHQFWYVTSHMFIIPFVDIYASGLDWFLKEVPAPTGLIFFFAVTYMNGIVLEVGRKIRAPGNESPGVVSYSSLLGPLNATWLWILTLFVTLILSLIASYYTGWNEITVLILIILFSASSIPAFLFIRNNTPSRAKAIEVSSGIWSVAMYLTLGGVPMLQNLFSAR